MLGLRLCQVRAQLADDAIMLANLKKMITRAALITTSVQLEKNQ